MAPPSSAVVSYTWSGNDAPSRVSFQAVLSMRLHNPGAAVEWMLLWQSPTLVCGPSQFSSKQIVAGAGRHPLDGWVRMLLHSPGDEHECYAFADVPSAALVAPTAHQQTMKVGESLMRVSIGLAPASPPAESRVVLGNIEGTLPSVLTSGSGAIALAHRTSPTESRAAMAEEPTPREAASTRVTEVSLLNAPTAPVGSISSVSPKRLHFLQTDVPAESHETNNTPASLRQDLREVRARLGALEAELASERAKNASLVKDMAASKVAVASASDAQARATREMKMRIAMDTRRTAAEERCAELVKQLRDLESQNLAAKATQAGDTSTLTNQPANPSEAASGPTVDALRTALKAAQAQSAALSTSLENVCRAVSQVCSATSASIATFGQSTVPSRDLAAVALSFNFDHIAVRAASNKLLPAAKTLALSRSDSAAVQLCNYSSLQASGAEASQLLPRLIESWKRCVDAEIAARHIAERARDDTASSNASALEERAALVREWEAYSQHWEHRGREAERIVNEWEKAHKTVVRSRDEAVKELGDVRSQLESTKAYLFAIGHGAATTRGGASPSRTLT
jgi:hypothetical protein